MCVLQLPVAEWEGLMSHDPFAFKLLLLNSIQQNPKRGPPHTLQFSWMHHLLNLNLMPLIPAHSFNPRSLTVALACFRNFSSVFPCIYRIPCICFDGWCKWIEPDANLLARIKWIGYVSPIHQSPWVQALKPGLIYGTNFCSANTIILHDKYV